MTTIETSGNINIEIPNHDFRDAVQTTEQTAECIKSKFTWQDGLTIEYSIIAGKIDFKTNGTITIKENQKYVVTLD